MTARKSTDKAAESEKDQSAVKDESKTVQTTKQAEEAQDALPTSAEKREVDEDDGNFVFEEDSEFDDEDFEDGGNVAAASGSVVERDIDGDEYNVPYVNLSGFDVSGRTSDSDDPAKSWTAQEASGEREDEDGNALDPVALVAVDGTPGQTFRVRELPDRAVMEAAGVDYDQWVAGLPVRADVPNEAPRRGIPA